MIPHDVKAEIVSRGADRMIVSFSGGNDEGGVDRITLMKGDTEVESIDPESGYDDETWDEKAERWVATTPANKLASYANGLVEGRYSFNGEFEVNGSIVVDTISGKASWSVDSSELVHHNWED